MNGLNQPHYPNSAQDGARRRVKLVTFSVLGLHAAVLAVLLIQGCRQEPSTARDESSTSNSSPSILATNQAVAEGTNAAVASTNPLIESSNTLAGTSVTNPAPELAVTNAPIVESKSATEYTIAAGDTVARLAKSFHTTAKAIVEVNPGLEATKLQVGQKIHLPQGGGPATVTAAESGSGNPPSAVRVYTVKSGDCLLKIAGQFGTTVGSIRHANGLKTDRINVGQKLQIPVKPATPAVAVPATTS